MMKISKPVLTNDFLLSPVQFTSLNTVVFKNVKNVYDANEKILLECEHPSKIEMSSRDWIGIFPRGWNTLQQYITFEWVSQFPPCSQNEQNKENGDLIRRIIHFCPKYHMGSVNSNSFYQFVYISKQIEVLGVSSFFRFDTSSVNDSTLELECLVPVSSKLRSTSFSDIGILMTNKISSTTSLDNRTLQTTSIHSLQNLEQDKKNWTKPYIPSSILELKKPSSFPRKSAGTGDALDPYSSLSEPVFPMSFPTTHCKKCFHFKRGEELLRSQQVLQSKVGPRSEEASQINSQRRTLGHEYLSKDKLKIVMERNKILEERAQEMKKEMEKLQAESKKLKTTFYNTNKEKVAYEKFVKDFIKSLEKDSVVRVVNGNTEFLVKKVNYVGMEEHPRDKKTSKRERELKAVIGLQEITIRNLINSLQEKAKSVQELNKTVKLAQAFSEARDDSREFHSDAEETLDEVSNSDVSSEYEFSLMKPRPPEEVTVEDTDTVLDNIRRTSEMELKGIGINRSLGKNSSEESRSNIELPNLSVRSYQNDIEDTNSKKPILFDSLEDCWPFAENTPKIIQKKVIESNPKLENQKNDKEKSESTKPNKERTPEVEDHVKSDQRESSESAQLPNHSEKLSDLDIEDHTNCESYYDACEIFNPVLSAKESESPGETQRASNAQEMIVLEEKSDNDKNDKNNFLLTAIIPRDLELKRAKSVEEWLRSDVGKSEEKKTEVAEKEKKFTCQLSIDFAAKVLPNSDHPHGGDSNQQSIQNGSAEEPQTQMSDSFDLVPNDSQVQLKDDSLSQKEKPLLSVKKCKKCLEIQITQVEQKENLNKNFVHQKMVVKFGKESQPEVEVVKRSKFEFNIAVTGIGEKGKLYKTEQVENRTSLNFLSNEGSITETNVSPRTVWNDASDEMAEITEEAPAPENEAPLRNPDEKSEKAPGAESEAEVEDDTQSDISEAPKENSNASDANMFQDSLRYEKNLEFLQQKTEESTKEEVSKDKPSAILIQNGQTKLALIRYQ